MVNNIKIKICGQNNPAIINHCLDLNISYQGLIFYEKSPRFIDKDTLSLVNQYFKSHKDKFVGVFVNPSIDEIKNKWKFLILIQFNFMGMKIKAS